MNELLGACPILFGDLCFGRPSLVANESHPEEQGFQRVESVLIRLVVEQQQLWLVLLLIRFHLEYWRYRLLNEHPKPHLQEFVVLLQFLDLESHAPVDRPLVERKKSFRPLNEFLHRLLQTPLLVLGHCSFEFGRDIWPTVLGPVHVAIG